MCRIIYFRHWFVIHVQHMSWQQSTTVVLFAIAVVFRHRSRVSTSAQPFDGIVSVCAVVTVRPSQAKEVVSIHALANRHKFCSTVSVDMFFGALLSLLTLRFSLLHSVYRCSQWRSDHISQQHFLSLLLIPNR